MSTAFRIALTGAEQVPVVSTSASGLGTAIFDSATTSLFYTITTTGLDWGPLLSRPPQTVSILDDINGQHFHAAPRGFNGPVVFDWLGHDVDDFTATLNANGSWTISGRWETTDPGSTIASFAVALAGTAVGADAPLYANIHTVAHSGGEIRGQLVGLATDAGETINGTAGEDYLPGLGGNDTIIGGAAIDTAVFSGNRSAYTVTRLGTETVVNGPDGIDLLTSVERLNFDDMTMVIDPPRNDFNGDGKSDLLFSNLGPVFALNYEWQLDDRSLFAEGPIDFYDQSFSVQAIGDFDGDAKSDLLFQNPITGGVWEWQLDGLTIVSQGPVDVGDPAFHLLGTGDFNGDGKDDVLFRNDAGIVFEWQMDGRVNTPLAVSPLDPAWHVQGAGDFNGDGKDDILLRKIGGVANEDGAFYLWQMNGNAIQGEGGIERPSLEWKTLGIGDFDGDGKDDFAVRNESATPLNGAVWIYLMNGTTIKSQGGAGIADAATWNLQQIADLNGDGKDDILYRNNAGSFYSWDMNGTSIASEGLLQGAAQFADPSFTVVKPFWDLV